MVRSAKKKTPRVSELEFIAIRGARENNLKNIDVDIPKKKVVVITGVSGSGKSSLAFDTLFREGQRRYVQSLSAYARQFLGQMDRARFDTIRGLAPSIAIEQKAASKNPRSTVGTITEISDYLRVLFARVGTQYCHICGKKVGRGHAAAMVDQIMELPAGTRFLVLAPVVENRKGEHREFFDGLRREGYVRVRIDGVVRELRDVQALAKNKKHNIEVVVDRLKLAKDKAFRGRLTDSVEVALKMGHGQIIVHVLDREDLRMSEARSCCGFAFPELAPPLFSFNSPTGMCTTCNGLGSVLSMDEAKLIPDPSLTIREGAVKPWSNFVENESSGWSAHQIKAMEEQWGIDLDRPWKKLPKAQRKLLLWGPKDRSKDLTIKWKASRGEGTWAMTYEGLIPQLTRRFRATQSEHMKAYYGKFMSDRPCEACDGARLKPEVNAVKIAERSIGDVSRMTIEEAHHFVTNVELTGNQELIGRDVLREVSARLSFLMNVGLSYLSLERRGPTLSGGEAQRIRLASQVGSELTGVIYILDEPSIGLHQRDNERLIRTLLHLRDIGNSLVVVEHDRETIESADWVVDIGPGAGHLGGQIVAEGTPAQLERNKASITGRYLRGDDEIAVPDERRQPEADKERWIHIRGASANNLKNIDASIPLGLLTCVTGVSGAGKSTLINNILYPALARRLHNATDEVGAHTAIEGLAALDKVINIDQKPIGRTPRSNPATYTKVFDQIRDLYAMLPESKARGYAKGRFSFNVKGGRCEECSGDGYITVEMHFLADVLVPCEVCRGRRFNETTLEVQFKTHSIADVLDLSVAQAFELFHDIPSIRRTLQTLMDVGLTYVKLGQAATTLSGGEAQRIKLARELAKRDTGRTLYILDEPTTGLHFEDVKKLLAVLARLVEQGNTVVVIEHNLDVIKTADWILDVGPEGGAAGGYIVAEGSPETLAKKKASHTGRFLIPLLAEAKARSIPAAKRAKRSKVTRPKVTAKKAKRGKATAKARAKKAKSST